MVVKWGLFCRKVLAHNRVQASGPVRLFVWPFLNLILGGGLRPARAVNRSRTAAAPPHSARWLHSCTHLQGSLCPAHPIAHLKLFVYCHSLSAAPSFGDGVTPMPHVLAACWSWSAVMRSSHPPSFPRKRLRTIKLTSIALYLILNL